MLDPPGFNPNTGFLYFDSRLSYDPRIKGEKIEIHSVSYDSERYRPDQYESILFYTHDYVGSGCGGYQSIFERLGVSTIDYKIVGPSIRDLLWDTLLTTPQ